MSAAVAALATALAVVLARAALPPRAARTVLPPHRAAPHGGDLLAALELVAAEVRSGTSLGTALALGLDRHPGVLRHHRSPAGAASGTPTRSSDRGAHADDDAFAARCLEFCSGVGAAAADVIDRAVLTIRERRAWRLERRAQAAAARLSARTLTLLPVAFAGWGALTSDTVRRAYTSGAVLTATAVGLLLNLLGWWWMRRLVRGAP